MPTKQKNMFHRKPELLSNFSKEVQFSPEVKKNIYINSFFVQDQNIVLSDLVSLGEK